MVIMISPARRGWPMLVLLLLPIAARPAEWEITPTLHVRESYTDNMNLAPPAQARGQFVTEVTPGIEISTNGPRLQADLSYSLQKVAYTHQPDRTAQQLDASAHAEMLADWLFMEARAGIAEHTVSAFGAQPVSPALRNPNTSNVRTLALSPYLRHYFHGLATLLVRYDYQRSSTGLLDVRSQATSLRLTGDNGGSGWNWDLSLLRNEIDDAALPPVTMSSAALTLSYPFNSSLAGFVTAGYEQQDYHSLSAQPQGKFGSVGGIWTPSPRTRLAANIGHRYFGKTYGLDASYRLRSMFWSFSYSEDITTTHGEFYSVNPSGLREFLNDLWVLRIPDPTLRRKTIDVFLTISQLLGSDGNVNFFSHRYFLQKQARLSGVYSTARSALALHLASTGRSAQTTSAIDSVLLGPDQLSLTDRTRQNSVQLGWNWRLSSRGSLTIGAGHSRAKSLSSGREDRNSIVTLGLTRQLSNRLSASADLHHSRHSSSAGGAYRENGVGATVMMRF